MGHVMRTLALAQAWQDEGGNAMYFQAESALGIRQRLQTEGVPSTLEALQPGSDADAERVVRFALERNAAWIVLDGYQFTERYQRLLKEAGLRILLLDDLGSCGHYWADVILNQGR